jgi:hypothetical protein
MKLWKEPASLWVAERRGRVVYVRAGKVGSPGIPKPKEHKTDAAAQAALEAARDAQLAKGFVLIDDAAGLDSPFTIDGKVHERRRVIPARHAELAALVRMHVRGGFMARDELDAWIDDAASDAASDAARAGEAGTADKLGELLMWVADDERAQLRTLVRPEPCINDRLDAAFAALAAEGIVAVQAAGFTQSDGWSEATAAAAALRAKGREARGACFYHEQDLARGVAGHGLWLTFGVFGARDDAASLAIGRVIARVLGAHEVPFAWNETVAQRISVLPFRWYRAAHVR